MAGRGVRAVVTLEVLNGTIRKTQVLRIVIPRDDMYHRVRLELLSFSGLYRFFLGSFYTEIASAV